MAIPLLAALGYGALAAGRIAAPYVVRAIAPAIIRQGITSGARVAAPAVGSTFTRAAIGSTIPRTFAMPTVQAARTFAMPATVAPRAITAGRILPTVNNLRIPSMAVPRVSAPFARMTATMGRPAAATVIPRQAISSGFSRVIPMGGRATVAAGPRAITAAPRVVRPTIPQPNIPPAAQGASRVSGFQMPKAAETAAKAAPAAAKTAGKGPLAKAIDVATGGGRWYTQLATAVATNPAAVQKFEESTGIDVPPVLEAALYTLGTAAGVRGGVSLAKSGAKMRKAPEASTAKKVTGGALQAAGVASVPAALAFGVPAIGSAFGGQQAPPAEATQSAVVPPALGAGIGAAPAVPGTPEEDAQNQIDAIDAAFQAAVDELTATYGGVEEMLRALETGDPYLAQALASLDAQYQQAQQAIAAEYSAATGDIAGYQAQADALMEEVAAQQAADYAAAAGGLEGMSVGLDPATAAMAEAAGVSDTAVGGGAITGAGLARGLAGAAGAAGAADRFRTGSELSALVAATRQDAAAQQAALTQNYLGQRYQTEREALIAEAERRQAIEDAIIQNKIQMGEALSGIELQRAQQLAALSPQDYAAASGQTRAAATNPAWFGAGVPGDFTSEVEGLFVNVPDVGPVPASVGTVNATLDQLTATASVARELFNQGAKAEALNALAQFYGNPDLDLNWFNQLGVPTTAAQAYTELFGEAPF